MGMLVNGAWTNEDRTIVDGAYKRVPSVFGGVIEPSIAQSIADKPDRFHLIASLSCPWSHRTTIVRALKGLESNVSLHVAGGPRTEGYRLGAPENSWRVPGTKRSVLHLHELYTLSDVRYTGRPTVPVLWDSKKKKIVSNESAMIVRCLDAVPVQVQPRWTLRPADLETSIDSLNDEIQTHLSNAVYRAGKAQKQAIYDLAIAEVFQTLDMLEGRLTSSRFLHGDVLTESDVRLWPTLVRFDAVYHVHFKCSRRRLVDYPALWAYVRDLYSLNGLASTFDEDAIRSAYYGEDREQNPFGIIANSPDINWSAPHGREKLGAIRFYPDNSSVRDMDLS